MAMVGKATTGAGAIENARVVVPTTYEGDAQAVRALKAGASAYLLKSSPGKDLIDAIRKCMPAVAMCSPKSSRKSQSTPPRNR